MEVKAWADFNQNLKSAEEMEEEERAAQSAKLQELIRRGGPEDLQEANRLMKVMAGYDTKHKTDYRAKAAEEVGKIQQKAKLLEERLQNFKPGETMSEGDVFEVRLTGKYLISLLMSTRNSPILYRVPSLRYRKCARKSQMIRKLSLSCLKSTIVYIVLSKGTSLSKRGILRPLRRFQREL